MQPWDYEISQQAHKCVEILLDPLFSALEILDNPPRTRDAREIRESFSR